MVIADNMIEGFQHMIKIQFRPIYGLFTDSRYDFMQCVSCRWSNIGEISKRGYHWCHAPEGSDVGFIKRPQDNQGICLAQKYGEPVEG